MTLEELNLRPDQVRSLYLLHLQQMYSAEQQLLEALPTIAVEISLPSIRQLILKEAADTPDHLALLADLFAELGEPACSLVCTPIRALVDLSAELQLRHPSGQMRDLLLIALTMEMKHLNIAKYVMATTYARVMNLRQHIARLSTVVRQESDVSRDLNFSLQAMRLSSPEV